MLQHFISWIRPISVIIRQICTAVLHRPIWSDFNAILGAWCHAIYCHVAEFVAVLQLTVTVEVLHE